MQEFIYKQMEDMTYCVMGYRGDAAEVIIPERYGGAPITALFDGLFKGHSEITAVRIPDTVAEMGEFVFDGCENLRQIQLPKQLAHLWGYTFARCGIEEIVLPDGLSALPPFAFKDCGQLRKVVCGSGMKKIYSWVFGGCDQLAEVIHSPDVEISPHAFERKTETA